MMENYMEYFTNIIAIVFLMCAASVAIATATWFTMALWEKITR